MWYLYYLPLLFIPLLSVYVAVSLGKPESFHLPRSIKILSIPSALLFLLVMTNDLHQWVFDFQEPLSRAGAGYSYGLMYWCVTFWSLGLSGAALFIMLLKCRIPHSRKLLWLPMLPFGTIALYIALYVSELQILRTFAGDMPVIISLLTIATFESCIRAGLIQTNTHYKELFHASTIAAQITDNDHNSILSSRKAKDLSPECLKKIGSQRLLSDEGLRISSLPIKGGYVVWQEDIKGLLDTLERLSDAAEFLEGRNTALAEEYRSDLRLRQIEEQNRLCNLLQEQTAEEINRLERLITELAQETGAEEEKRLLSKMILLGAYIKRRNNFVFI